MAARDEVLQTLARYCRALDDRRLDDLRDVFADECVLTLQDGTVADGGDAAAGLLGGRVSGAPRHRHLVSSVVVEVDPDGDGARASSDWYLVMPDDEAGWFVHSAGTYEDELARVGDHWVLTRRTIRPAPR